MSENQKNNQKRIRSLYEFSSGIINGENGSLLLDKHNEVVKNVTPKDIIFIVDLLVKDKIPTSKLKTGINKILNVFYKSLINLEQIQPEEGSFLYYLIKENDKLITRLKSIRPIIKQINKDIKPADLRSEINKLRENISDLNNFNSHYLKIENILFPFLEKEWEDYGCLSIMWSYHDDIRRTIKETLAHLEQKDIDLKRLNRLLGGLFFNMYAMRFREENILFPVALESGKNEIWKKMLEQSFEIGFSYIKSPERKVKVKKSLTTTNSKNKEMLNIESLENTLLDFETGQITLNQAIMLLNHLPVDITYVDEKDEVRYFSKPKDRFFPRSKAIIGRKVQNCHPPKSVHIVNELIDDFKAGKKDKEIFWIQMKGKFILIQYFVIRNTKGEYKGVLEVSQDITEIRKLKGEKRLMEI